MNIFKYDRDNSLIEFIKLNKKRKVNFQISLHDNVLIKKIREGFFAENIYVEYTVLQEKSLLTAMMYNGEYWVRAIKVEQTGSMYRSLDIKLPTKEFMLSFTGDKISNFTVSHNVLSGWSNILVGK